MQERGIAFRLIVMGQSFANNPSCFEEAERKLRDEILHFGYVETRNEYADFLHRADLIVSTARHEFFGISILEGIRAGCYPLLPANLSYPELYDEKYLYRHGELILRLSEFLLHPEKLVDSEAYKLTQRFDWNRCKDEYGKWLFE